MGRRDPDPRPPIEIVGAPSSTGSVQVISTQPGGSGGSGGRRALAAAVGVLLLLVGGLALGEDEGSRSAGDGKEPRDNSAKLPLKGSTTTRPRPTTTRPTTTTTTIPLGPVFGRPVAAGLLIWGSTGWTLVDLDTGVRTEVALPTDNTYEARAVAGGVVMVATDGSREASFHPVGRDGAVAHPVRLGPADQVLASGRPDRVWLLDGGGRAGFEGEELANSLADVRLVDLRGQVLRSFQMPARFGSHGLGAGVVLERAGRVYLADEGGVHAVAVGYVLGVVDDDLMLLACDDRAVCGIERRPVDGGAATPFIPDIDVETSGYESITAADGRVAMMGYGGQSGGQTFLVFTDDGRPLGSLEDQSLFNGPPRWLPDGLGLVSSLGDSIRWIRERDGEWAGEGVPALDDLSAEVILIVEW